MDEKITEDMFERVNKKLCDNISCNEKKLNELREMLKNEKSDSFSNEECLKLLQEFLEIKEPTREMMLKLINKIEIHKDKTIDIHFNFKELNFLLTNS